MSENASERRQSFSSASRFEDVVGYSRAVRVGNRIYLSGTTATGDDGELVAIGEGYGQAVQIFRNIEKALGRAGATLANIVRTRMFVTDIKRWPEFGRAHKEYLGDVRPCATMVEVSSLIDPRMLIEIEVEAEL